MRGLNLLAKPFVVFVERYYPDPFVFAILLTLATFGFCFLLTPATPTEALVAWGNGLPALLSFMAQISLTLITAHAFAHTDLVQNGLKKVGQLPRSASQAYFLVAFAAGIASLFAWSLGLIAGALIAQQVALQSRQRGVRLHYPLLVASAYSGFVIWHMGYSSSAALFVATPGHSLESAVGIIPVTETIFSSWNIAIAVVTLFAYSLTCMLMKPQEQDIYEVSDDTLQHMVDEEEEQSARTDPVPAEKLERSRIVSLFLALLLGGFLFHWFATQGLNLNLNIVNWSFLMLGLLLARSPLHYIGLIANASRTVAPVLIQYPFYAGIMGLMADTGMVGVISQWFTDVSSAQTLPFWAFVSGGLVNFFIPSGGGQWAVQGPIFLEAANQLQVDPALIVMGVAYGDQWTNMIQPFWTIPLLAIAGLHMRQILGYTFVIFLVTAVTFGGGILLASQSIGALP